MRAPRELSWAALLLSCAATSLVTTLVAAAALRQLYLPQQASQSPRRDINPTVADDEDQETRGDTAALLAQDEPPVVPQQDEPPTEELHAPAAAPPPPPKRVVALRGLSPEDVPQELRVDAFFAAHHVRELEHRAVLDGCTSVFAVLDAIHPYLEKFFRDSAWVTVSAQSQSVTILKTSGRRDHEGRYAGDSDDDDDDDDDGRAGSRARATSPSTRRWRLPECIDPAQATEIVLYPGVDPRTFMPDKIVNLDPNAPRYGSASTSTRAGSSGQRPLSPSARRYSYGRSSFDDTSSPDHHHDAPPKKQIVVLPGALVLGGVLDVSEGSIFIGRHVRIEPNTYIKGPCIIGDHSTVRSGAYLRGDLIIGRRVVLRGELKNALVMDHAELCHPGYCGDSLIGYKAHFGNQVTTANLNLFYNTAFNEILVDVGDHTRYNTGRKKIGVVLGDFAQLGCSTVTDPCTLVRPNTVVYALTRLSKGIYGPNVIVKNKPLEKGVLEIVPLVLPAAEETEKPMEAEPATTI